ncbi:MAG: alkaline phosphatase D family protein [Pseudomonadales bacterium]|nr:alkaline phosphatase D family protein [Pseudomonadales bacterium]
MTITTPVWRRRQFIKAMGATLGALSLRGYDVLAEAAAHFTHGIASGDPLADRVILWTRVIPGNGRHESLPVNWEVSKDAKFRRLVASGETTTSADRDYTVKVDATGLRPGESYFYRFISRGVASVTGQTRTLPQGRVRSFRMGVASCSNFPQGYFNAYRHMSEQDLDLVLHLGDYIYEYAEGDYANPVALNQLHRHVKPDNEILSLEDYRTRYGLYRTDEDLQALHARHPWICVWDDHELMNNTWKAGAENHNEGEGDFMARVEAARQAYHEWLPIRTRTSAQESIYRSFQVGDLADLIMLDTRLHGRDRGLDYNQDVIPLQGVWQRQADGSHTYLGTELEADAGLPDRVTLPLPYDFSARPFSETSVIPVTDYDRVKATGDDLPDTWGYQTNPVAFRQLIEDESRTIMGMDQENWVKQALAEGQNRGATWQVLGQQVLIGKVNIPYLDDEKLKDLKLNDYSRKLVTRMRHLSQHDMPFNLDAWDGYAPARRRLYEDLKTHGTNPLVLAGDTHNAWAFNLRDDAGTAVGIEVGTPGISSPGLERFLGMDPAVMASTLLASSPELVETDTSQRGWTELTLTPKSAVSQFHFVSTILSRNFSVQSSTPLVCKAGTKQFDHPRSES